MSIISRQIVAIVVIAAYGGISILGHGLHWLAVEEGHHHGLEVVRCSVHGDEPHHAHTHNSGSGHCSSHKTPSCEGDDDATLFVTAGGCIAHSHQCQICAFLALVSGSRPSMSEIATGQQAIGSTALVAQLTYFSSLPGWHTPRGPPSLT
jgi:hypothetical protein